MKTPILLLHGALGTAASFDTIKSLLASDFDVHTLNFAGHGHADFGEELLSISLFAEQVVQYLEENELATTAIFGYSMGGYVGMYLAKHFPTKVTKLYTLATKWDWTPESGAKEAAMLNPIKIKEKVPKFAAQQAQLHGDDKWEVLMQKVADMLIRMGNSSEISLQDCAAITIPTRLSVGDKDAMVSMEETILFYRSLPNAELLVMPNTKHPFEQVNMQELAHHLLQFFK